MIVANDLGYYSAFHCRVICWGLLSLRHRPRPVVQLDDAVIELVFGSHAEIGGDGTPAIDWAFVLPCAHRPGSLPGLPQRTDAAMPGRFRENGQA